jgi:hypothetical protein
MKPNIVETNRNEILDHESVATLRKLEDHEQPVLQFTATHLACTAYDHHLWLKPLERLLPGRYLHTCTACGHEEIHTTTESFGGPQFFPPV